MDEFSCLELVELEEPGRDPGGDVQLILGYKGLESRRERSQRMEGKASDHRQGASESDAGSFSRSLALKGAEDRE